MAPSWRTRSEAPKGRAARGSVSPRKAACRATLRGGRLERSKATGSRTGASPVAALTIEPCNIPNGTDMTPHTPENPFHLVVRRHYGQCAAAGTYEGRSKTARYREVSQI